MLPLVAHTYYIYIAATYTEYTCTHTPLLVHKHAAMYVCIMSIQAVCVLFEGVYHVFVCGTYVRGSIRWTSMHWYTTNAMHCIVPRRFFGHKDILPQKGGRSLSLVRFQ